MVRIHPLFIYLCTVVLLCQCASRPQRPDVHPAVISAAANRQLVDLYAVVPGIVAELPYGTPANVTKQKLYPKDMPLLMYASTAVKLQEAQRRLQARGLSLKVWDAWRPPEIQLALYDHGGHTGIFSDPSIVWSRHCSGTAVDVTVVDRKGRELKMPTPYDEATTRSSYLYTGSDQVIRANLRALQDAMVMSGFSMLDTEWWHFDDAEFNKNTPPPVVFASELGIMLPKVKPRVRH